MATFNERFDEYTSDMLHPNTKAAEIAAEITGLSEKTMYAYKKRQGASRTPDFQTLLDISRKFAVTLDWLSGEAAFPKWRPEIPLLRLWLRGQLPLLPGVPREKTRVLAVLKLIEDRLPQARDILPRSKRLWFLPGILGLDFDTYDEFVNGEGKVTTDAVERLASFTGVSKMWYRLGEPEFLVRPSLEDVSQEWAGVVETYALQFGESPELHLRNAPEVHDFLMLKTRAERA